MNSQHLLNTLSFYKKTHQSQEVIIVGHEVFRQLAALKLLPARLDRIIDASYLFAEGGKLVPLHVMFTQMCTSCRGLCEAAHDDGSRAPHPALLGIAGAVCKSHPIASQQQPTSKHTAAATAAGAPTAVGGGVGCEIMVHRIPSSMTEEQVKG
jgi:hypothetical protein